MAYCHLIQGLVVTNDLLNSLCQQAGVDREFDVFSTWFFQHKTTTLTLIHGGPGEWVLGYQLLEYQQWSTDKRFVHSVPQHHLRTMEQFQHDLQQLKLELTKPLLELMMMVFPDL